MYNRHIRHLVTELGNRLSDKEFLKKIGLSRRSMQQLFDKDRWEVIFEKAFPVTRRFSCAEILEFCRVDMEKLSNEPEEGWLSFAYKYSTHILYPDADFAVSAAPYAPSALYFLNVLQYFFDEERKVLPFDPYDDFRFLTEEEYAGFERAGEYAHFIREFRDQYIYEMMRLNREATPFETLGHIAGVHYVAMVAAGGFMRRGCQLTWRWRRAQQRDMTSENLAVSRMSGFRTFTIFIRTSGLPPTIWKESATLPRTIPPGIWSSTISLWSPWF